MSSRFHCGWCLNLISVPSIGLGHYDPLSSHEIDGVRKEKERLTAVTVFSSISWCVGDSCSIMRILSTGFCQLQDFLGPLVPLCAEGDVGSCLWYALVSLSF